MDSIEALEKVYHSLSRGASVLDFQPSDIMGDCAAEVQEIVRQKISGKVDEDALNSVLSCLKDGNGLNYLGLISARLGHWNCSVKAYEKALSISEKLGDLHGAAQTYGNLGSVYYSMGEWKKAIEFYQKSLETKEKLGDVHGAAQTYNNLGLVYADRGEWKKAIEFYQKSLETKEKLGDVHGAAQTYGNLGLVYADMGEWKKAIEFYQKSLETLEKLGDVHGKGITLANMGKLHLDKQPPEPEAAQKYLEESIKLLNSEARPHYPNALNWLASCYHRLGIQKKGEAKRETDQKKKEKLTDSASKHFSDASMHYNQVAALPRVNLPSLQVYAHLDKGLSLSVKHIAEQDDRKAVTLIDNALDEFKKALKFADEKEKLRLRGIISDHEAKRYIRLADIEKGNKKKQDALVEKAIQVLENAAKQFERFGDEKLCSSSTCEGCMHLFEGLKLYREGIKEYGSSKTNNKLYASIEELGKARNCYNKAENELGKNTVRVLNNSFEFVEKLVKGKDEILVTSAAPEFNKIIDELSSVGLQKMVRMYTFDESMNVKKDEIDEGEKNKDKTLSIPDAFTIAAFFGWASSVILLVYGYAQSNALSLVIGGIVLLILTILKLKKKH